MEFNLTTHDGRKTALDSLAKLGPAVAPTWLVVKALDWILSPDTTIQEQRKTAIELIRAGRDNNVDEMSITVDQTAGVAIGTAVDGIPVKATIGKSGQMTLVVRYKNA